MRLRNRAPRYQDYRRQGWGPLGTLALCGALTLPACASDGNEPVSSNTGAAPSMPSPQATGGSAGSDGSATATPGVTTSPAAEAPANESVSTDTPVTSAPTGVEPGGNAAGATDAGAVIDDPAPACERSLTESNVTVVRAAIDELFVQGDITAVDRYWGEPYLQHNPIAASGVATFRSLFGGLISPNDSIYQLSRIIGECELVLIHGDYTSFGGPTFDMFRVEGGRIVEHWDAAALGAGPNASGHGALDGESEPRDVALGARNGALVLEFVQNVLQTQAFDGIDAYMSPDLIEHSPESADGSAAYVQNLRDRLITYRQVHHDIADGNFVFVLSEGSVGDTDVAHYDLFRVEAGRIVEHWDGRRTVPATTQSGLGIF
ncbi:MAG TPA: nuclear transport factor 2 family protein [Polyangiaceae bacterium]|nr:nuclear transport factor 2 family protein [Polyangiaceae bacterium]